MKDAFGLDVPKATEEDPIEILVLPAPTKIGMENSSSFQTKFKEDRLYLP